MKILHVVASLQAASGGPAVSVSRIATEQARRGHEVTVVACDERHLGNALPTEGVRRLLVPSGFLSVHGRGWSRKFRKVVMKEAARADIVHNHGLWMWPNAYAREAAVAAGKPLVISPRGMLQAWSLNRSKLRKAIAWRLFEKKNLESAAMFHATAASEAESIRDAVKRLRDKKTKRQKREVENVEKLEREVSIVVAPNGVDLPDLTRKPERDILEAKFPELKGRRWIVFMSRLHPKKGIDVLLRAWARQKEVTSDRWRVASGKERQKEGAETFDLSGSYQLVAQQPVSQTRLSRGPVLIIAGGDMIGYRKQIDRMVREMGLENSVVITGQVQGETKECLLANADVFVLPSYSENFGIVVAEAMAWSRPVIASTGTPWKVIAEVGAGWWVDPTEGQLEKALADALGSDREQLTGKGAAARKLVELDYSWSQAADKLLAAYAGLSANRSMVSRKL